MRTDVPEPSCARTTRSASGHHKPHRASGMIATSPPPHSGPPRGRGVFRSSAPLTDGLEARWRLQSVAWPCECPSARTGSDLEPIIWSAHKKRTGLSSKSERPVQLSYFASSVAIFAIDHRGRQLGDGPARLIVRDRCVLLTLLVLISTADLSEFRQAQKMADNVRAIVARAGQSNLGGRDARGDNRRVNAGAMPHRTYPRVGPGRLA